jgi:hypothetical protein
MELFKRWRCRLCKKFQKPEKQGNEGLGISPGKLPIKSSPKKAQIIQF